MNRVVNKDELSFELFCNINTCFLEDDLFSSHLCSGQGWADSLGVCGTQVETLSSNRVVNGLESKVLG